MAPRRSQKAAAEDAQQQHHHEFEFAGPHGPALLVVALPLVVLALPWACNERGCVRLWPTFAPPPGFAPGQPLYTHTALAVAAGWFALTLALHLLLPGARAEGVALPDGSRLTYKLNAFRVFLATYVPALALSRFGLGVLDLSWAADSFVPLLVAATLLSTALAAAVYAASFLPAPGGGGRRLLSRHGDTGYPWYDFWMGRELNPRWGGPWLGGSSSSSGSTGSSSASATGSSAPTTTAVDVKEFCELYPGMIAWAILNLAFAAKQAELNLAAGTPGVAGTGVTLGMLLVNAFQLWYVGDALANERSILTTMDITTDGFGFMLAFGDLAWVPFTFTTTARYLAWHAPALGPLTLLAIAAAQFGGYYIFRGANAQKDAFRRDPNGPSVRHLRSMPTARGTRLLVSGWWGAARHINYLGDWLMGLAWCMPAGVQGLQAGVPYFYAAYFAALLAHRERRDDAACRLKYGPKDWGAYCARVPWRIVPRVY